MNKKGKSLMLTIMMILSTTTVVLLPTSGATQVVITDSVRITEEPPSGPVAERMSTVIADSEGNVHYVWSRNTQHLYYSMWSPRSEVLIDATQISDPGLHRAWHPDIAIDDQDRIHIVWADKSGQHSIKYTVLNPALATQNGEKSTDSTLTVVEDTIISQQQKNRDWPAIALDSLGAAHIVWEDSYDSLDKYFAQPQIYYSMVEADYGLRQAEVVFDDTLITPIIGHKGHPDIAVDSDDYVQIVWDDTRGGKVELVFVIDTSGSMYSEWADVCTVIYGGTFSGQGGTFEGIKPMLENANMTVFETLYGLGTYLPSAASTGNCQGYNMNSGPRNTPLGIQPNDDSGGIRTLGNTVYSGSSYSGYSGEDWGPGTNWACLSWRDVNGNVGNGQNGANPPTSADHRWNPNSTKIVIPISDEGPKDGDTAMQSDDIFSIEEAHDSCIAAGVIPVGMYGQSWGASNDVRSHFLDLTHCPIAPSVSLNPRNCPGTTVRTTDAGGQTYEFPVSGSNQMALLVEAMVYISTNNSREIFTTVLDPYGKLENPGTWIEGDPGHITTSSNYVEDIGPEDQGHLVVVNDTRVTIDDAYSLHPSLAIDSEGYSHIAWMDGRDHGFAKNDNYEVYYKKVKLRGSGAWDGAEGGLSPYAIEKIGDTVVSNVEVAQNGRPYGPSSTYPAILTDKQDNVHIAWLDNFNATAGEEVRYVRLNQTDETGEGGLIENGVWKGALDPWESVSITSWESDKLGPNSGNSPDLGQPPGFANDLGSGAHVTWTDTNKCNEETNNYLYTVCYTHVLTGQVDVEFEVGETYYHVIQPGQQTQFNLTVNNSTPGPVDLVADTYSLSLNNIPTNWTATLYFSSNDTAIFPETPIFLLGSESVGVYLKVRAPSIYQASGLPQDELASIVVEAVSWKDPAIRNERITQTLMDIKYGIDLDTSHSTVDVEQGLTAVFSITITNTGNVYDTFNFFDPSTLEGGAEWGVPFGWGIRFLEPSHTISLDPGQSATKNLEIDIPTKQSPTTEALYLKGWSTGEPFPSRTTGTYDVLTLYVNVSIRSTGNIDFYVADQSEKIYPGECASYVIEVTKNFDDGRLIFSLPGAPDPKPDDVALEDWKKEHWTYGLDFEKYGAPGDNSMPLSSPRLWAMDATHKVEAWVCAPTSRDYALAGIGPALTVKANLEGYSRVSDSVILSTRVGQIYDLDAQIEITEYSVNPGESIVVNTEIFNNGNIPDNYDIRLDSSYRVDLETGNAESVVLWDIQIPRQLLVELQPPKEGAPGGSQEVSITVNTPEQVEAGLYRFVIGAFSEESCCEGDEEETYLRDTIILDITVKQFHDLQLSLDPLVENDVKTTAPGRTVQFVMNLTNNGNVVDTAYMHNYTESESEWSLGLLDMWQTSWAIIEDFNTESPTIINCLEISEGMSMEAGGCYHMHSTDQWIIPEMGPYETLTMIATVDVSPQAKLTNRYVGLKTTSMFGSASEGGDFDETETWEDMETDTNEQKVTIRLRAPNPYFVGSPTVPSDASAAIGDTIPITVTIGNDGNAQADDVEIIICQDQDYEDVEEYGCEEDNIVYRQVIGALKEVDAAGTQSKVEITLLYPVTAGSHEVVLIIDPNDNIIEKDENDNIKRVDELSSSNPVMDVALEVVSVWALPFGVFLLTISLLSVVYLVGRGRRSSALDRIAEQTSLMGSLND